MAYINSFSVWLTVIDSHESTQFDIGSIQLNMTFYEFESNFSTAIQLYFLLVLFDNDCYYSLTIYNEFNLLKWQNTISSTLTANVDLGLHRPFAGHLRATAEIHWFSFGSDIIRMSEIRVRIIWLILYAQQLGHTGNVISDLKLN